VTRLPGGTPETGMHGVLLIDKPAGPTSHDVVAWARRFLGQRDIGHTGTLDPMATGLLVLVVGQATRLSSLLTGKDKSYEAEIRLGFSTDTDDADGTPTGEPARAWPEPVLVRQALEAFVGPLAQRPPAHSAKKVGGRPAYERARRQEPVELRAADVVLRRLEWLGQDGDRVRVKLTVSAGFYVRALARDLGDRLGSGAHLSALRRTASGSFTIADALTLAAAEGLGTGLSGRLIRPAEALPDVPGVVVGEAGLKRVRHGNAIDPALFGGQAAAPDGTTLIKILSPSGDLVALGEWRGRALHPVAVLG
jgi:tRNA pseudouridine55 synthase